MNIEYKDWKDVFEPIFKDQHKIHLSLIELESLRNAIAHTRTLPVDGMTRLEQYNKDIFNMTKALMALVIEII